MSFLTSVAKGVAITIIVIFVLLFLISLAMPTDEEVSQSVDDLYGTVAFDAEEQYYTVKTHGDPIGLCVRASMVAEAYLQAGDDAKYAEWKQVERDDCKAAGMPR